MSIVYSLYDDCLFIENQLNAPNVLKLSINFALPSGAFLYQKKKKKKERSRSCCRTFSPHNCGAPSSRNLLQQAPISSTSFQQSFNACLYMTEHRVTLYLVSWSTLFTLSTRSSLSVSLHACLLVCCCFISIIGVFFFGLFLVCGKVSSSICSSLSRIGQPVSL